MNQPVEPKMALSQTQNLAVAMAGDALVMMVDDEELVIDLIQAYLDSAGYKRFISTTDPRNALELMLRERPQVVLLDINMPGMSGLQIMQAMRANPSLHHIPVVVLTAVNDPETKLKALGLARAISSASRSTRASSCCACAIPWRRRPTRTTSPTTTA